MLAREAFREMLFPLSEKELHYREHPEDSLIYFKNFRYEGEATVVTGADNSDEILFFSSPKKQAASNLHGVISPKIAPRVLEGGNLAFNKQTRFGMVPLHRHNYIEMNYVYSGTCVQEINGQTVEDAHRRCDHSGPGCGAPGVAHRRKRHPAQLPDGAELFQGKLHRAACRQWSGAAVSFQCAERAQRSRPLSAVSYGAVVYFPGSV